MNSFKATAVTFLCLFCNVVYSFTTHQSNLIKWVNVTQVSILDLEPAGAEVLNRGTTYIARTVYHDSLDTGIMATGIIPGKLIAVNNEFRAHIYYGVNGEELFSTDFEVLTYPRGMVSWIAGENILSLDEKVVGGIDPFTSELLYLCRLVHSSNESIPLITPGKLTTKGDCVIPYYGEVTSNVNYEVLVVNAYGKFLEMQIIRPLNSLT